MRDGCSFCQTARTGRLHLSRSGPNWVPDMTESLLPPFFRIGPERPVSPVILSVPHAGRDYGAHLLNAARLRKELLETLEDRLVDRLIWRATALGMTAFVARAPRLEIDLNREERELDPSLIAPPLPSGGLVQSARTRGGLGLIPSRLTGSGPIWRERIPRAELDRRLDTIHRPFHAAIAEALVARSIDLICLAGFMRLVGASLLDVFPNRVVNIHPSLLPSFPGLHAQAQALEHGVRISGVTVHLVNGDLDAGPIILQATVPVLDDDTAVFFDRDVVAAGELTLLVVHVPDASPEGELAVRA